MPDLDSNQSRSREVNSSEVETGLSTHPHTRFDQEKALRLLLEHPNNVTTVCKAMGVSRSTWKYHQAKDPIFAARVQEIRDACCDALEETMFNLGKKETSYNFNDRIAYLRAHRPDLYNPTKRIIVEGHRMGNGERVNRLGAVETTIDAEITKTYLDRKERQQLKQQQQLEGDGKTGGEKTGGGGG